MANEPITRSEKFMKAVATGEPANITPITRKEMFLAKAAGQDVNTPTPITREEMFLSKISEGSGSGGSGGGTDFLAQAMEGTLINYTSDAVIENVRNGVLNANKNIEIINLPNLKMITANIAFANSPSLREVYLPNLTTCNERTFDNCPKLKKADFSNLISIPNSMFSNCTVFDTLILRNSSVCELTTFGAFVNSPFINSMGTVYVPRSLIESYQNATNWSVLYADGTCNFVAIEGSEYE